MKTYKITFGKSINQHRVLLVNGKSGKIIPSSFTYLLFKGGVLKYIGVTKKIGRYRLLSHPVDFEFALAIVCEVDALTVEAYLISLLNPPLNKTVPKYWTRNMPKKVQKQLIRALK